MARVPGTDGHGAVAERVRDRRGGQLRPIDEMLLHSPEIADGWNQLLGAIRNRIALPADVRELIILRVGALNNSDYEWQAHLPEARAAGLPDSVLDVLQERDLERIPEQYRAVVRYTDAMTVDVDVDDTIFAALSQSFSSQQVVEITTVVAAYNMVSRFLVALEVELPMATEAKEAVQ